MAAAQAIMASLSPGQAAAGERHGVIEPVMARIEKWPASGRLSPAIVFEVTEVASRR